MKYYIQKLHRGCPTIQDPNGRSIYEFLTGIGFETNPKKEEIVTFSEKAAEAVCAGLGDVNTEENTYFSYHPAV